MTTARTLPRTFSTAWLGLGLIALLLCPLAAQAEGFGYQGWGVRGGISSDPDQFVLGMHLDLGEFAENVRFTPNADIGFGDDFTVFTANPDVTYALELENAGRIYFGGTIGFIYWKWDAPGDIGLVVDDTQTDLGIAGVVGYEFPVGDHPLFVDLKIGISDEYPDLKAMLGYTFFR